MVRTMYSQRYNKTARVTHQLNKQVPDENGSELCSNEKNTMNNNNNKKRKPFHFNVVEITALNVCTMVYLLLQC